MEDENKNNEAGTDVTAENTGANDATEKKKTFEELLQDKDYQSAFDKKIAQSLQTAKTKWEEEQRSKQAEADKLAKMDEDQKLNYQLQEALKRADEAEKKLSAKDLESETIKQANAKGIPLELISTIDFNSENAESIAGKLAIFEKTSKSIAEKAKDEYSREEPPKTGENVDTTDFSKMSYDQIAEYLSKHPNANL